MCDEMCKTFPNESGRGYERTFRLNPGYICMLTLLMWSNHFFWTLYTIFFVAFCTLNRQYFMAHTYITFSEKIYYLSIYRICHEVYVCMWVCARKKSFVFPNESPKSHRVVKIVIVLRHRKFSCIIIYFKVPSVVWELTERAKSKNKPSQFDQRGSDKMCCSIRARNFIKYYIICMTILIYG